MHDDWYPGRAPDDPVWLELCGQRRWVVLTKDDRIRYDELAKRVMLAGSVPVFTLTAQDLRGVVMAGAFVTAMRQIENVLSTEQPPYIAYVTRSGRVSRILKAAELDQRGRAKRVK